MPGLHSGKYFPFGIVAYQDLKECFQEESSLTVSLVIEVNHKTARMEVRGGKSNALVLSGHLNSKEELRQQSSVATTILCQPPPPAEWPSSPLLTSAMRVVLYEGNALKEIGSSYLKNTPVPSQRHDSPQNTLEIKAENMPKFI